MATQYWKKGSSDYSLATSWQTATNAAGAVPTNGDTVYFSEGDDNVTAGMNQSAVVGYAELNFTRGGRNRVGSAASVFRPPTAVTLLVYNASGGWLYAQQQAVTTARMSSIGGYCAFSGTGTIATLESYSGRTDLSGDVVNTTARIYGGDVAALYNATAFTTLSVFGGRMSTNRTSTTFNISGGTAVMEVSSTALGATTANINGGYTDWRRGGCTTMNIEAPPGSVLDFSNVTAPLTIATANIGPGITVIGSPLVTVTTTNLRGNRAAFVGNA